MKCVHNVFCCRFAPQVEVKGLGMEFIVEIHDSESSYDEGKPPAAFYSLLSDALIEDADALKKHLMVRIQKCLTRNGNYIWIPI